MFRGRTRSGRYVDDSLNAITVRVDDKGGVVMWTILCAQFRNSVVSSAVLQSRGVKMVYGLAGRGGKGDVDSGIGNWHGAGNQLDGQLVTSARRPVADGGRVGPHPNVTQRRKRRIVKDGGACQV